MPNRTQDAITFEERSNHETARVTSVFRIRELPTIELGIRKYCGVTGDESVVAGFFF
jgi:hypothetical protein